MHLVCWVRGNLTKGVKRVYALPSAADIHPRAWQVPFCAKERDWLSTRPDEVLLSRQRPSKYPPDDFVAMRLETSAVAEHNALRSPRMDFCECCSSLSLLQQ